MAAGIGSRFGGGIKQLAPIDAAGHIIMDYSIHDAIAAGCNHVVFIIRRDIEADFREVIGNRIEKTCAELGVKVDYAFQEPGDIPGDLPEGRTKPWGTGQAVLSAQALVDDPFVVINADDYYGRDAYKNLFRYLSQPRKTEEICMAGFILKNTLSENGGVTRGLCQVENGRLTRVVETGNIVKTEDGASADGVSIDPDGLVSMNMWGMQPGFFQQLAKGFEDFFKSDVPRNPLKAEYLLPIYIGRLLEQKLVTVDVLPTRDRWFGVTYKEDKAAVMESFRQLINAGIYRTDLYSDLR